jgi:hypothetical protein
LSENALTAYQSQVSVDECDLQHAEVILGGLLEAREDPSTFLQPTNEAFDDVPFAVGLTVELDWAGVAILVALGGNHRRDALAKQVFVDPIGAESFVCCQADGAERFLDLIAGDCGSLQQRFQRLGLMGLSGGDVDMQRMTVAITEQMDFCRKSAPRAA